MSANQNANQSKATENSARFDDAVKAGANNAAGQGARAARDSINKAVELGEKATDTTKKLFQTGVETASLQAREASDRLTRTLGFSGDDAERLKTQAKQNMEAVSRCSTVLTQAVQDTSRNWFELAQKQWQRNLDGLNKLTRSQSVQEFSAIRSELVREGLQQMVQDSRAIIETSMRAVDEAGKAFSGLPQGSRSNVH
jgi:hypothetical protein